VHTRYPDHHATQTVGLPTSGIWFSQSHFSFQIIPAQLLKNCVLAFSNFPSRIPVKLNPFRSPKDAAPQYSPIDDRRNSCCSLRKIADNLKIHQPKVEIIIQSDPSSLSTLDLGQKDQIQDLEPFWHRSGILVVLDEKLKSV